MLLAKRSFQSCVPGERAIFEPAGIKFPCGKKSPCLPWMFPIQDCESQIHLFGGAFECSRPVIYALGIDPARLRGIFLANQKRGNQHSVLSQRTRNRGQPTLDQIEAAMAED